MLSQKLQKKSKFVFINDKKQLSRDCTDKILENFPGSYHQFFLFFIEFFRFSIIKIPFVLHFKYFSFKYIKYYEIYKFIINFLFE